MIERDESQIKREMWWWGGLAKRKCRGVKERDTTESETDGQIDGSVVCITE